MLRLSQRPLTGSALDRELFVDRNEELAAAERGLQLGLNVAVVGPPGSGRTSFLHQLRARVGRPAVYVEGRAWSTGRDLVHAILSALGDERRFETRYESSTERVFQRMGMKRVEEAPSLTEWEVEALGEAIRRPPEEDEEEGRPAVPEIVFVDEPDPRAARMLFGAFRDTLWTVDLLWVVGIKDDARSQLLAPPANAFFGAVVDLPELSAEDAIELLRRRAASDAGTEAAAQLERLSGDIVDGVEALHPRPLLEAAAAVLQSRQPERVLDVLARAQAKASGLGRTEAMLFEELRHLGPVHAGDEQLLQRMGVTRSRIVQALQRLEEVGLVVGEREGRRKVYRVTAPTAHETQGIGA